MFVCFKGLVCIFVSCVSLDHFDFVLLVFFGGGVSVPSREIGWEERLRDDLFCVEWDVKPYSIHPQVREHSNREQRRDTNRPGGQCEDSCRDVWAVRWLGGGGARLPRRRQILMKSLADDS